MWRIGLLLTVALLAGCASTIPEAIRTAPAGGPTVAEVRQAPERFVGSRVRWGGTIAEVDNRAEQTLVQVVARELSGGGRPYHDDRSEGRFIARFEGFIDPAVFANGRLLTVSGTLQEAQEGLIGEHRYRFPVVAVSASHLWEPEPEAYRRYPPHYYDPFWYDPWYSPYRPYAPWPYYW